MPSPPRSFVAFVLLTVALSASPVLAGEPALKIGSPAPAFEVEHWLEGTPVEAIAPGEIYVVELWATWCGPCRESMPHLERLQETLGRHGVHVVGVTSEDPETVEAFFEERGAPPAYAIASDPDGSTGEDWLEASGKSGIPTAFIVGRTGRIEWIGHPMQMTAVLTAVAEDRFERDLYASWQTMHDERLARIEALRAEGNHEAILGHLDALIAAHREDEALYGSAKKHELQRFRTRIAHSPDLDAAYEEGQALVDAYWDDANLLNELAWAIATDEGVARRDLELALRASVRSNLLTQARNAAFLDTLARIYYEQGQLGTAVRYQRDALAALRGKKHPELEAALERYLEEATEQGLALPEAPKALPPAAEPVKIQHI